MRVKEQWNSGHTSYTSFYLVDSDSDGWLLKRCGGSVFQGCVYMIDGCQSESAWQIVQKMDQNSVIHCYKIASSDQIRITKKQHCKTAACRRYCPTAVFKPLFLTTKRDLKNQARNSSACFCMIQGLLFSQPLVTQGCCSNMSSTRTGSSSIKSQEKTYRKTVKSDKFKQWEFSSPQAGKRAQGILQKRRTRKQAPVKKNKILGGILNLCYMFVFKKVKTSTQNDRSKINTLLQHSSNTHKKTHCEPVALTSSLMYKWKRFMVAVEQDKRGENPYLPFTFIVLYPWIQMMVCGQTKHRQKCFKGPTICKILFTNALAQQISLYSGAMTINFYPILFLTIMCISILYYYSLLHFSEGVC